MPQNLTVIELCCVRPSLGVFLETNNHENGMRPRLSVSLWINSSIPCSGWVVCLRKFRLLTFSFGKQRLLLDITEVHHQVDDPLGLTSPSFSLASLHCGAYDIVVENGDARAIFRHVLLFIVSGNVLGHHKEGPAMSWGWTTEEQEKETGPKSNI